MVQCHICAETCNQKLTIVSQETGRIPACPTCTNFWTNEDWAQLTARLTTRIALTREKSEETRATEMD